MKPLKCDLSSVCCSIAAVTEFFWEGVVGWGVGVLERTVKEKWKISHHDQSLGHCPSDSTGSWTSMCFYVWTWGRQGICKETIFLHNEIYGCSTLPLKQRKWQHHLCLGCRISVLLCLLHLLLATEAVVVIPLRLRLSLEPKAAVRGLLYSVGVVIALSLAGEGRARQAEQVDSQIMYCGIMVGCGTGEMHPLVSR